MYRQCLLRRGATSQVSFIPAKFARRGALLRLRGENGWTVGEVYQTVDVAIDLHKSVRQHEKHTGDSLPRNK